jgi:hypothetical protein
MYCLIGILKAQKQTRRIPQMKAVTMKRTRMNTAPVFPYPNAATKQEMLHKFLDLILVGAIGAGCAACLLLFLAMA